MMQCEHGNPAEKVWLIGNSEPTRWRQVLSVPLDSLHPARHNIWTSVLDVAQRHLFVNERARFDDQKGLYVRNAVQDPDDRPRGNIREWPENVSNVVQNLARLLTAHRPVLVLTFGAFAYEFSLRAARVAGCSPDPLRDDRPHTKWTAKNLGAEFRAATARFSPGVTNLLPLLHVSIARGRFMESHRDYCAAGGTGQSVASKQLSPNYFEKVGATLAELLWRGRDSGVRFMTSNSLQDATS
ncbi:MAG TPA: hypothetical protein VGH20_07760 [Myxococcales bacterium]|jgi:hypothetical protein